MRKGNDPVWIAKEFPILINHYHEKAKFPFCPSPEDNESLSSWMTRIAHANFISTNKWLEDMGSYSKKDIDNFFPKKILWEIHIRTGMAISQIKSYSLANELKYIAIVLQECRSFYTTEIDLLEDTTIVKYCPLCFQEDENPYFRKEWKWRFIQICQKHWCILQRNCPKCNLPINIFKLKWQQTIKSCPECGFDLSNIQPQMLSPTGIISVFYRDFVTITKLSDKIMILLFAQEILFNCSLDDWIYRRFQIPDKDKLEKIRLSKTTDDEKMELRENSLFYIISIVAAYRYYFKNRWQTFRMFTHDYIFSKKYKCVQRNCPYESVTFSEYLEHVSLHADVWPSVPFWMEHRKRIMARPVMEIYIDDDD